MHADGRQPSDRPGRPGLGDLTAAALDCTLCRLCSTRTHVVFGSGDPEARVMFVGEGPGYHEDRAGMSFVGSSGELFTELLASVGLVRDDVYVTTVVKCRPPNNRSPFPDEIEQCEGYLFRQITSVQPDVVCTLGNVAIRLLTGKPHRLTQVHGQTFEVAVQGRPITVLPLYHPAAAANDAGLLATLRRDMRQLATLLRAGRPEDERQLPADVAAAAANAPRAADEPVAPQASSDTQLTFNIG